MSTTELPPNAAPQTSNLTRANPLTCSENSFPSFDGTELFYRSWIPEETFDKAIILLHRGHEHSGRLEELARSLNIPGAAIFAWDQRGHGRSPGERGWAEGFSVLVRDLDTWVRHLGEKHGLQQPQFAVVAHSVAAVIASAWVHDYAPRISALVLGTPAFQVKLYVPLAIPGLRVLQAIRPRSFIKSYVGGGLLTHDRELARQYDSDPLISRNIAVNILLDLFDTSSRLVADAGAIRTPVLMLTAGSDAVVAKGPQKEFFDRLSSPIKRYEVLPGFKHAIFHESNRASAFELVRNFIEERFNGTHDLPSILSADKEGYTRREYDALSKPLPASSLKRWSFAIQSLAMKTLGRLSRGIAIGWRAGFDSGESLDHVYEDEPRGFTGFGRMFDYFYINSVGWKGIRQRKVHLERALEKVLRQAQAENRPLQVVDIASGPGRYLLDTVQRLHDLPVQVLCRDRSATGLAAGRAIAQQLGVQSVTYQEGDAFDADSLAAIEPRPTVAIVSGLYELFPQNEPIRNSLSGLHRSLPVGGWLIYTNQPWHPQVEMIARVLPNRDGKPWIMRRRTQEEMDELVRAAGFEKVAMEIDRWGIFTVSVARKR